VGHRTSFGLTIFCAVSALLMISCAGLGSPSQTTSAFQLTVTAPANGAGTITSSPAGIDCPTSCNASFAQGTKVTLTETPGTNYFFAGWGGSCSGTSACSLTITAAASVTATFHLGTGLTVTTIGSGQGTVTSSPAGINCPSTCSASFAPNSPVTLSQTPAANNTFGGWGGACSGNTTCSVTVASATNVTATFTAPPIGLTVSVTGTGTVTSSPAGISCSTGICTASFPQNTVVTLSETPGTNFNFGGWGGACAGTSTCSFPLAAASTVTATFNPSSGSLQSLNHIIIFIQENRSLDHYFGYMEQYWANNGLHASDGVTFDGLPQFTPAANCTVTNGVSSCAIPTVPGCDPSNPNGADVCTPDASVLVPTFHMASICTEELSPFWNEAHRDWNLYNPTGTTPTLNGFVVAGATDARQYPVATNGGDPVNDINGYRTMGYFQDSDLPFYYYMASNFATSDRWFAPMLSRTQLNRMFLLAATSGGHAYPLSTQNSTGPLSNETIFQALQNAGISWKIYVNSKGTNGCTDDYTDANSQCLIQYSYINMFQYYSTIYNSGGSATDLLPHIASVAQFEKDAAAGQLPQVALIEPASDAGLDEHPTDDDATGGVNIQAGAAYAESVIEALMYSPSWNDSAMIFSYDEPGGFYDHVPPQMAVPPDTTNLSPIDLLPGDECDGLSPEPAICTFGYTGYRVPMMVISPFAKKNYVSHTVYDHTAILHLIEERFNVPALTARDAAQTDMSASDFFDFVNVPWAIPPAQSSLPQQQTNGSCSLAAPTP